jgi:hypothetical protein
MPRIFIASKNYRSSLRGAAPPGSKKVDVTSAQFPSVKSRGLSPMLLVRKPDQGPLDSAVKDAEVLFPDGELFENFWQRGKVFRGANQGKQKEWWKKQKRTGKRRWPGAGKGAKRAAVVHADWGTGKTFDYIESRKQVYVPEYLALVKSSPVLASLAKTTKDIVVYDFDGPRDKDNQPQTLPVTLEMLREKINDKKHPFGHGYVVAAELAGIKPSDYTA